jgi:uncharacterized protein (TIGR03437 family)
MRPLLYLVMIAAGAQSQTLTTIAGFTQTQAFPTAFFQEAGGNFYLATQAYEHSVAPTVVKLTPDGSLTTVYSATGFTEINSLIQGIDGNFYGIAANPTAGMVSVPTSIFKLTPSGAFSVLYTFSGPDGLYPSGLLQASDGNLYGITEQGGASYTSSSNGIGTIFKLTPSGVLTSLYSFTGSDGAYPGSLFQGADGNLYGTTQFGGTSNCPSLVIPMFVANTVVTGCGTIFRTTPAGAMTVLHQFTMTEGDSPGRLIPGADGNFYGTTAFGGVNCVNPGIGCGTFFKTTRAGSVTTIVSLDVDTNSISLDFQATDGNFYGTSLSSPSIVKMTPAGTETTVYTFCPQGSICPEGGDPNLLIQGADGSLYGTTTYGGANQYGTVFRLVLPATDLPSIAPGSVLNGASFEPGISPGSWMTVNGTNLSTISAIGYPGASNGVFPTTFYGVSLMVGNEPAYLASISPTQINALVPNVPAGTTSVAVVNSNWATPAVITQVSVVQPAFFQWGNYAVATHQDFSLAAKNGLFPGTTTVPAKPGEVIILWGTGFGPTNPSLPAGVETPSAPIYNTTTAVSVTVGNQPVPVYGAALAPGYAGLYQIAIQIPASLANGDYRVVATISGAQSPSGTLITVAQ